VLIGVDRVQKGVKPTHLEQKVAKTLLKPVGRPASLLARVSEIVIRCLTDIHRFGKNVQVTWALCHCSERCGRVQKGVKLSHLEQKGVETRLKPVGGRTRLLVREAEFQ